MRFFRIDFREANLDESFTMRVVRTPLWTEFFKALLTVDCHPPISYLIQKVFYWIHPSVASVRMVSVLFGTAVVPLIFWAFRPFLGKRIALTASFLAATSYILVWYSRVARNYEIFFALSVLLFGLLLRLLRTTAYDRTYFRLLVAFGFSLVACLYVHHTTMLMLPILFLIYLAHEITHPPFRRRLFRHLLILGVIFSLFSIPAMYQLYVWSFDHFSQERVRPTSQQLIEILSSVGWGGGWRLFIWGGTLLLGFVAVRKRTWFMALVLGLWVMVPIGGYLLLTGMTQKFIWFFYRYSLFIQVGMLGFVAAFAVQIAEAADRFRWRGRRLVPLALALLILVGVRAAILGVPYATFYQLRANQQIHGDVVSTLRTVPYHRILGDNYYFVVGALREYKPSDIHVAYPPIFNNAEEYVKFKVPEFVRRACENDPLLAYFGTGMRLSFSKPQYWEWLRDHFARRTHFFNKEGYELAVMGLNYFSYLDKQAYFQRSLRYNTLADLPGWYARKGIPLAAGYGEGWLPVPICTLPSWRMWYCMEQEAELYLYNAGTNVTRTLSFEIQTGSKSPHLWIYQNHAPIFDLILEMPPPMIYPLNKEPPFQAYVSFPGLIANNEGIMPHFAGFQFASGRAASLPFVVPPGLTILRVRASDKAGLLITDLRLEEPPAGKGTP